jgi:predicted Zn-dependent protease with MMP-like domain
MECADVTITRKDVLAAKALAELPSEFEDDRMSYVVVQMDKSLRDALRTLLAAFDAEGS